MYVTVYMDIIFVINLIMDFFILSLTSFIIRANASFLKIFISSFIGSALYCIIIYSADFNYIDNFILCFFIMSVITAICFKPFCLRQFIRNCLFTYMIATLTGGICFYIYFLLEMKIFSFKLLLVSSIAFYITVKLFINHIDTYITDRKNYCGIEVFIKGKRYSLTALIDTGTYLRYEKSSTTVIIAEKEVFTDLKDLKEIFIPFRSLGQESGTLPAVYGKWAIINKTKIQPVIIGLYDGKLSNSFNAIISTEAIGGE